VKAVDRLSASATSSPEYTGVISRIYPVKFEEHFTGANAPPVSLALVRAGPSAAA
jgi:hypothetical protein